MLPDSWVEIRERLGEVLTESLDFVRQLDLIGEFRELPQLVASSEVDANVLGAAVLYVIPLVWLMRRWRRGGVLSVITGVVRLFVLAVFLMFAIVALLVRLEGRTYRW